MRPQRRAVDLAGQAPGRSKTNHMMIDDIRISYKNIVKLAKNLKLAGLRN